MPVHRFVVPIHNAFPLLFMKNRLSAVAGTFALLLSLALPAQTTAPKDAPPIAATPPLSDATALISADGQTARLGKGTTTQKGMSFEEFKQVNAVMIQVAQEDPAIVALSEELEELIARREAMIVAAACQKNPALADKIRMMRRNAWQMKLRKSDIDGKAQVLGTSQ